MDVALSKSEITGEVIIPPSKSVAHRKMICAALSGCPLRIEGGKDMEATSRCLNALKPFINRFLGLSEVDEAIDVPVLNAGESGSTLRFLLPIACALGAECVFDGEGRLKDRPLGGLIDALTARGAVIERSGDGSLKVGGKLTAGEFVIDGGVSSQYITGLLFALPLLDGDSVIKVNGRLVSENYVHITLGVLRDYGIEISDTDCGYCVKGNQSYKRLHCDVVEGDWSSAGFMLALGALTGNVRLKGLNARSLQGDKIVVELLKKAGADIAECEGDYIAKKSELTAIEFDAQNCPDAVPIMATALSFARGASRIYHVDRLRDKESDRLSAVREMLSAFGIKTEYHNDTLAVYGGEHKPCEVWGYNDHRMAMSAMVCALATDGESSVRSEECIAKSYPTFLEDVERIGAKVRRL